MGELFSPQDLPSTGLDPAVQQDREAFVTAVWDFYRVAGRGMEWRSHPSPYWVFVSEVMLQQTQVARVTQRFPVFVSRFPGFLSLAEAPLSQVMAEWTGLGYNRRGRFLHQAARQVVQEFQGELPADPEELKKLPGIGPNTAGSVAAFAFNRPVVFVETNIRRVVLHHFFHHRENVPDSDILPVVEATLCRENPREWYWALMDYGVYLSKTVGNANRRSRHYSRQSPFENSDRQLRGRILRLLTETGSLTAAEMPEHTGFPKERVDHVLGSLSREGMLAQTPGGRWVIAD